MNADRAPQLKAGVSREVYKHLAPLEAEPALRFGMIISVRPVMRFLGSD